MRHVLLRLAVLLPLLADAEAAKLRVPKDHATIQAAIDAAAPGDVVLVSKGTYFEELSISKTDLTVRARKGHVVVVDAGGDGRPLGVVFSSNVTVKGLRFRNTADDVGVGVAVSSGVVLKKCRVEDVPNGHGIEVGAATVSLVKCRVEDVGGDGIRVGTNDADVKGCVVRDVGGAGISVLGARVRIEGNTVERSGAAGVLVGNGATGADEVEVVDNDVTAAGGPGVHVAADADAATVRGNSCRDGADAGFRYDGTGATFEQNLSRANAGAGFAVTATGTGGAVLSNKAKKGLGDGFHVQGVANTFVGNEAKKNAGLPLNDETDEGDNTYDGNSFDPGD